ncbi:MAG TPA: ABC transporter ATP-binding protein [Planctomycetota bacterium]|nr:ABC transporter ATP-binding protein [Planctomycetota bacterium]
MIELDAVRKTYRQGARDVVALDSVSMSIRDGEFLAVMGRSGSGKSTLLHLAGALDLPSAGSVRIDGVATSAMTDDERTLLRRHRLGFVFQFFHLIPTLRVGENVALPLLLAGIAPREATARAERLLDRTGIAARRDHFPAELSGGEQQRAAIARALVIDPPVVLADEPTGNLDSATARGVLELLREVAHEKRTVVLVTHDPTAAAFGDRIVQLRDGRVDGTAP